MSANTAACDRVADNLERLVESAGIEALAGETRRQIDAHLEHCAPCRALVALAQDEPHITSTAAVAAIAPADFTTGILARTSGSACKRATDLLCALTDGLLGPTDTELLRLHLCTCNTCATLSTALSRLAQALPNLAEMQPDQRFVDDVLARTLPASARLRRLVARWSERWTALVQRPRFSWEAAYIGAIMLSLLFGAPASPLRHVPREALAMVQANPLSSPSADGQPSMIGAALSTAGNFVWDWSGRPVGETLSTVEQNLGERYGRTAKARASLHIHVTELGHATVRIESTDGRRALQHMGEDIKTIWSEFTASAGADEGMDTQTTDDTETSHE